MSNKIQGMVCDCQDLKPNQKHVLGSYADHADHWGNNVFPSVDKIAWKTSYTRRQVQRITRELDDLHYLMDDGTSYLGTNKWYIPNDGMKLTPGGVKLSPLVVEDETDPDMGGDISARGGDIPSGDIPSGVKFTPKSRNQHLKEEIAKKSPAWAIAYGMPVEEIVDTEKPLIDLEAALHVGHWPWESTQVWTKFANWVRKQSELYPGWQEKYALWLEDKDGGKYSGMKPHQIRQNPQAFMDTSFHEFLASYSPVSREAQLEQQGYKDLE